MSQKVFCIGFPKTGTSSMDQALKKLGYKVKGHINLKNQIMIKNVIEIAFAKVHDYDAFQDTPWAILYKELDSEFPGNKFILTIRPTKSWIKSISNHIGNKSKLKHEWVFGAGMPKGNEEIFMKRYEKHNKEVMEYFKDRKDDFLVLNLENGDGWDKLCKFLNKEVLSGPFPHANRAIYRRLKINKSIKILNK